jgi:hypothetical protein
MPLNKYLEDIQIHFVPYQLLCGGLYAKRKCGVVSLSAKRLWNAHYEINNTPHLNSISEMI